VGVVVLLLLLRMLLHVVLLLLLVVQVQQPGAVLLLVPWRQLLPRGLHCRGAPLATRPRPSCRALAGGEARAG
jgi:hypothetical protein